MQANMLADIGEVRIAEGLKNLSSELAFLFSERGVANEVQGWIGLGGPMSIEQFASIDIDEKSVREWLAAELGLRAADGREQRRQVSSVVAAWAASKTRLKRQDDEEAAARAIGAPRQLRKGPFLKLRGALETLHDKEEEGIPDEVFPAKDYIDIKVEQIEEGEMKAESLDEVATVKEGEKFTSLDDMAPRRDGTWHMKRQKFQTFLPSSSEQLRAKFKTMGFCWEAVKLKSPHMACLAGLCAETWLQHVEFLLSADVYGLEIKSVEGRVLASPSWALLLSYDHEIRRKAFKEVNMKGRTIKEALKAAQASTELRERYLTTPMRFPSAALSAGSSIQEENRRPLKRLQDEIKPEVSKKALKKERQQERLKNEKGKSGKGRGSWNETTKGPPWQQAKPVLPTKVPRKPRGQTADGRKLCYAYAKGTCVKDQCQFAHLCPKCEKGPIDCPRPGQC